MLTELTWDESDQKLHKGNAIAPPPVFTLAPSSPNGYGLAAPQELRKASARFEESYFQMLRLLEASWLDGGDKSFIRALEVMFELGSLAQAMMRIGTPDGRGYCPSFRYHSWATFLSRWLPRAYAAVVSTVETFYGLSHTISRFTGVFDDFCNQQKLLEFIDFRVGQRAIIALLHSIDLNLAPSFISVCISRPNACLVRYAFMPHAALSLPVSWHGCSASARS